MRRPALALLLLAAAAVPASAAKKAAAPTTDYYASPAGGGSCIVTSPCTFTQALAAAQASGQPWATVHLAAGTYTGAIETTDTLGVVIAGAGTGATILTTGGSSCGNVFTADLGAKVQISGLSVSTTCAGASDLVVADGSQMFCIGGALDLQGAPWGRIYAVAQSLFRTYSCSVAIDGGGGAYGLIASNSAIVIGAALAYNGPSFSEAVLEGIDGSFINIGDNTLSGSATGLAAQLVGNSVLDIEDNATSALPGSGIDASGGSWVISNVSGVAQ